MIRLEGPIRDHLEDHATDERVARIEQKIGARRLGRGEPVRKRWLWFAAPLAASAAIAVATILSTSTAVPEDRGPHIAAGPGERDPVEEPKLAPLDAPDLMSFARPEPTGTALEAAPGTPGENLTVRRKLLASKPVTSPLELSWERADAARAAGRHEDAVLELGAIVRNFPADPRAGLASFIAARIQLDVLSRPAEAARSIEEALELGLEGDLREAARARLFEAHLAAGDREAARRRAHEYLAYYPDGPHAAEAKALTAD